MKTPYYFVIALAILAIWAVACQPQPIAPGPEQVATSVFQTVVAEQTRVAAEWTPTATDTPEPTPDHAATQAAETAAAQTQTAQAPTAEAPTATPEPSATPTLAAATLTPVGTTPTATKPTGAGPTATTTGGGPSTPCNQASLAQDVTAPPGASFRPDTDFTKTWQVKNTGSCTWTTGYSLVFDSGNAMSGKSSIAMPKSVKPGETVDLSVDLTAPNKNGEYTGNWRLRDASGAKFGLGSQNAPLVVKITVSALDKVVYNFIDRACDAKWRNADDTNLACPGTQGDPLGWVQVVNDPVLENGTTEDEPALLTYPSQGAGGAIRGRFPAFNVKAGDHFQATIGCLDGSPSCKVKFQLRYRLPGQDAATFGQWAQTFDGDIKKVDVDLTSLAGEQVEFVLVVLADGASDDDRAFWLMPRIVR